MYTGGAGSVMFKGKLSPPFEIKTGVKQGCLLSPFLFLLVINWIMKSCDPKDGIQWTLTEQLNDLDYADAGFYPQIELKCRGKPTKYPKYLEK